MENQRNEKGIKKGVNYRKLSLFFLVCLAVAVIIEIAVFNVSYFRFGTMNQEVKISKLDNLESLGNETYKVTDPNKPGKLLIDLNAVGAKKLSFFSEVTDEATTGVPSQAKIGVATGYNDYGYSKVLSRSRVVNLTDGLQEVTITLRETGGRPIKISEIKAQNGFHFNLIRVLIISSMLFLVLLTFSGLFYQKYAMFSFAIILFWGLLLAFLMPIGATMDEQAHMLKSISVANGDFLFKNDDSLSYAKGFNNMYEETIENPPLSYNDFRTFLNTYSKPEDREIVAQPSTTSAATYPFIPYLASGIGVKLAMLFKLPPYFYVWLARAFNVLVYALLAFLIIRKIPYGKRFLVFFLAQPVLLYLAASPGVDGLLVGLILLGFVQILALRYNQQQITWRDFLLIALWFSLAVIVKPVYAPIVVLFFLLRRVNFASKKQQWISYAALTAILFVVAVVVYVYSAKMGLNQWKRPGTDTAVQLSGILHNPIHYLGMVLTYFSATTISFSVSSFGLMGYLLTINDFVTVMNIGLLLFLCLFDYKAADDKQVYLSVPEKGLVLFSSLSMLLLSATALYITFTPVGLPRVEGYQARYLLPMTGLLLFVFGTNKVKGSYSEKTLDRLSMFGILMLLVFVMLRVLAIYYK